MTAPPQQTNGAGPPPLPDGTVPVAPAMVTNALLNAVQQAARSAAAASSGAEAKDFLSAALSGAQAIVVLDPSLSQGGTPLAHDAALENIRGQTQENIARIQATAQIQQEHVRGDHALRQAKERAAAPTPARRKSVSVRRDETGRASEYSVTES